ncbi:MAG: hypothetical protein M9941_17290 [Anaerolineae bacterium]|nr:hypothetical protein [Anaerolineae bacterium]
MSVADDLLAIARHLPPAGQATRVPAVAIAGIGGMAKRNWRSSLRSVSAATSPASTGFHSRVRRASPIDRRQRRGARPAPVSRCGQAQRCRPGGARATGVGREETPRLLIFDNWVRAEALLKQWLPVTGGAVSC